MINMRAARIAAMGVAVGGVLTAAAGGAAPEPMARAADQAPVVATVDRDYLRVIHRLVTDMAFSESTDAELVQYARGFCANGADTGGLADAEAVREFFDTTPDEMRSIFRVMASYYCPERVPGV